MDRSQTYRQNIKDWLNQYHSRGKQSGDRESQLIFDEERDHYLVLHIGWNGSKRIYYPVIHFDIKNGKIWLQENTTYLTKGISRWTMS